MQNNDQKRTTGDEKTAVDKSLKDAVGQKKAAAEPPVPVPSEEPVVDGAALRKPSEEEPVAPASRKAESEKPAAPGPPVRKAEAAKAGVAGEGAAPAKAGARHPEERERVVNRLRAFRIERMMSKAELARKAGLSVLTVARIESGYGCRMDTKRKILKALGLRLSDRRRVFEDD
jgi:DNA-binding XRE family transcriptional regulator